MLLLPVLALPAAALLASSVAKVPERALLIWLALGPALFPFVRLPSGNRALVTFDRAWIVGLGVLTLSTITDLSAASRNTRSLVRWLAALSFVGLVRALLGSRGRNSGLTIWLDAFTLPLVVLLLVRSAAYSQEYIDRMLLAIGVGGSVAGLIGLAEKTAGFSLASYSGGLERLDAEAGITRIAGPYDVPEVFVAVLLVTLAATICWAIRRGNSAYPAAVILVSLQLSGIFFSYFRSGWASALLIMVGLAAIRKGRKQRSVIITLAALAMIVFLTGQLSSSDSATALRLANSQNTYGRLAAYVQGVKVIENNPFVGVGLGGYHTVAIAMAPEWSNGVRSVTYPHNTLIQITSEMGVIGLVTFLGVVWA
ncbi:MAG: O-antigen ligase family protein, partial [Solirubrobacterales bacterium]|nr:O-antigen ligase family protein [Solirubrobacterales bacterium]